MNLLRLYWTFARPFTLVLPMIGIFSGALLSYGTTRVRFPLLHGGLAVAVGCRLLVRASTSGK